MKTVLLVMALISVAPLAQAQIVIQTPPIPGVTRPLGPPGDPDDHWRRRHEGDREDEWRRRAEFRHEEHRREQWHRPHCVRNWQGEEYCRR